MARPRSHRIKVQGVLEACAPLHVGGMRGSVETDMPLARDGQGRLYVPGTSLAGPIRAWVEDRFGPDLARRMWGWQAEKGAEGGWASHVFVEDAPVCLPGELPTETWDHVGIDREWGAAAAGTKYDRAVLPKGTTFDLRLDADLPPATAPEGPGGANEFRAVLGHLLEALHAGEVGFGAARTRGFGRVKLRRQPDLRIDEEDWSCRQGVIDLLRSKPRSLSPRQLADADPAATPRPKAWLRVEVDWEPDGPVMVKASQDGLAVDMLPMVSGTRAGRLALVIPGSSTKGALRSQSERIVRTVLDLRSAPDWQRLPDRLRHLHQVDVPLVRELFGAAKRANTEGDGDGDGPDEGADGDTGALGRGALEVDACYSAADIASAAQWQAVCTAPADDRVAPGERSRLYTALNQTKARDFQQAYHIAIDRWTGGAADGFLYSALEPFSVAWQPLVLRLDLDPRRLSAALQRPAIALVLLLVRDLALGRLALGFGSNRGYGAVKVKEARFTAAIPDDCHDLAWLKDATLTDWSLAAWGGHMKPLEQAWGKWIADNRRK